MPAQKGRVATLSGSVLRAVRAETGGMFPECAVQGQRGLARLPPGLDLFQQALVDHVLDGGLLGGHLAAEGQRAVAQHGLAFLGRGFGPGFLQIGKALLQTLAGLSQMGAPGLGGAGSGHELLQIHGGDPGGCDRGGRGLVALQAAAQEAGGKQGHKGKEECTTAHGADFLLLCVSDQ